jgi:hypothetical protein
MVAVQGQVIRSGCIALGPENLADPAVDEQGWGGIRFSGPCQVNG